MKSLLSGTVVAVCALLALTAQLPAADAPNPLGQAMRTIGAATASRLRVTGFGSAVSPTARHGARGLARQAVSGYVIDVDLVAGRADIAARLVAGGEPANLPGTAAWRTPHGFLRAAVGRASAMRATPLGSELSYLDDGRQVIGTLGSDGFVDRVRAWDGNAEAGFVEVETFFRDYERHGPIRFPRHITEYRNGTLTLDLWVSSVEATAAPLRLRFLAPDRMTE